GIGSNLLTIEGVTQLGGVRHRLLADMIEVGSFIGLAAMTQSELTIRNADTADLGLMPEVYERMGVQLEIRGADIFVPAQKRFQIQTYIDGSILSISDHPWPGLSPDLLSILLVMATQAQGTVLIQDR